MAKVKLPRAVKDNVFLSLCRAHGLPEPVAEYRFHPSRKWRFDWLFPGKLALEVQGGLFVQGRHSRGAALLKEHEKLNAAATLGYRVMFCTPSDVQTGKIFETLRAAIRG